MMVPHESAKSSSLIPSNARDLVARSSALARRALDDILRSAMSPEQIHALLSAGSGVDLDAYGEAAKAIIRLAPPRDIRDDRLGTLVFELVHALRRFFPADGEPNLTPSCHGQRYFPPSEELRDLLVRALQLLVGPFSDPLDAILVAFARGGPATRVEAAEWLESSRIPNAVSILRDALAQTDDGFFTLVLRHALVCHDEEDFDTVMHALADYMVQCSSDTERDWCGNHLFWNGFPLSAEQLGRLVGALESSDHDDARKWALSILVEAFQGGPDDPDDEEAGIKRLKDCSDGLLENLTRIAWLEFLRENDLDEPYVSLNIGARGHLLLTLQALIDQKQVRWDVDTPAPCPRPDPRYWALCYALRELLTHAVRRQQIQHWRKHTGTLPDDPSGHRSLAEALRSAGLLEDSIAEYRAALRIQPQDKSTRHDLANALKDAWRLDEALQEFRILWQRDTRGMSRWRHLHDRSDLAGRLRKQGNFDEAIQLSRELIRLAPRRPSGYYELAQCFREQGRFADALPYFERAVQLGYDFAKDHMTQCRRELDKGASPA